MSKYRVTFDALGQKTEKAWVQVIVDAEKESMAVKIAEGSALQKYPAYKGRKFMVRKVEKMK